MQAIYAYKNYREALRDFYEDAKQQRVSFSFKTFSHDAGFNSPNYLKLIIDGERNLTVANIHGVCKVLNLKGPEIEYFEALVLYNQASSSTESRYYEMRLRRLKDQAPKTKRKLPPNLGILQQWYYPALLLYCHDRDETTAMDIATRELKLARSEIAEAIALFKELKLVEEQAGKLGISQQQLTIHDPKNLSLAQQEFLRGQIELSMQEFKRQYHKGSAKFISHALTIPADGVEIANAKLLAVFEELTKEMDGLIANDKPFQVMQVNTQIFVPLH